MNKLTRRIVGLAILITLVVLPIILLNRLGFNEETLQTYVEQMGIWAPLGLFSLRFISVVIPALPSEAYSILTGGLLGFGQGLIVVCLSDLLSCTPQFLAGFNLWPKWCATISGRSLYAPSRSLCPKTPRAEFLPDDSIFNDRLLRFCSLWCWPCPSPLA